MINLPVLHSLTIEHYELYPPSLKQPFVASFQPGGSAVIGVNGSGKSTFVNICLRCLSGPAKLPSSTLAGELGHVRPRAIPMGRDEAAVFASRVADGARTAIATLAFSVGASRITVKRKLSDLTLIAMTVASPKNKGTEPAQITSEDEFQEKFCELVGVGSFFDVLLILHFLTFMHEDRRSLVWDPTAQRQILRVLLLPTDQATEYATAQQELIAADSAVRNTQYILQRQENIRKQASKRAKKIVDAEAERRLLVAEAAALNDKLENAATARLKADNDRHRARLDRLKAAQTRESVVRNIEQIKTEALSRAIGPSKETLKYILGHILSDGKCLVCGTDPSPAAKQIEEWATHSRCPICGSEHELGPGVVAITAPLEKKIKQLENELNLVDEQIADADARIEVHQARFLKADDEFQKLDNARLSLDAKLIAVLRRIPAERAAIGSRETDEDALRRVLANERSRRTKAEKRFNLSVTELAKQAQRKQQAIGKIFDEYSRIFLKEDIDLLFQTVSARVGQGGASFEFPAFRLSMSGGSIAGQTVRESPLEVSKSQSEFIDLAFRMALMEVVSEAASLVVDAPEASLDFLFAERAGEQLARFSTSHKENRVIVTSYLPSHHLLHTFFGTAKTSEERKSRIVNLIEAAAPNAAIRSDKKRYARFLAHVIDGASPDVD